ncbi:50S ribosomal protein L32 [candidate division WWE3 bacterium]|nr:50S ribosomal protein L32 [candidate division WWE3 bacterium]
MPVPKRRHSKSRVRQKRNAHEFRKALQAVACKHCKAKKLPHRLCQECGKM